MFRFRSFRSRIAFYFLGLVSLVQIVAFVSLDASNERVAREQVGSLLEDGTLAARRTLETRASQISQAMRASSADATLREAVLRRDLPALRTMLERARVRSGTELFFVVSEGAVVADASARAGAATLATRIAPLAEAAHRTGAGVTVKTVEDEAYQVVVQEAAGQERTWFVAADLLDARFAEDLLQATRLEAGIVVRETSGARRVVASSLPTMRRAALGLALSRTSPAQKGPLELELYRENFLARVLPLGVDGNVELVLLRSLAKELEAFEDLRSVVLFLSIGGLILSLFGALFVARSIEEPARALTEAAETVAKGEYPEPVQVRQDDEMGTLAKAFDGMVQGLVERDRVREVLGKVVAPDVAAKILSREVELGGEERAVAILFSDLRGFRPLGGAYAPRETVDLLNAYLTRMTAVIEAHGGVVDKYLGSGIMAVFGAPVAHEDDAGSAIGAALGMQADLDAFNDQLARSNLPALEMGVGVHFSPVLAGNIGSPDRRGYSVIGEGVDYAARLEGLAARGRIGGRVLASSEAVRRAKRVFSVRPLVATSGQSDHDLIYVVLGERKPESDADGDRTAAGGSAA